MVAVTTEQRYPQVQDLYHNHCSKYQQALVTHCVCCSQDGPRNSSAHELIQLTSNKKGKLQWNFKLTVVLFWTNFDSFRRKVVIEVSQACSFGSRVRESFF